MTLLFWFRKNTRALFRPGTIYCRVTVDAVEYNFASPVRVHKDEWDAARQQVRGRTETARVANKQLQALGDGLREAEYLVKQEGGYLTPERIVLRYQKPNARQLSLCEACQRYLAFRDEQLRSHQISAATREADGVRLARLEEWLADTKRADMRPGEFSARRAEQLLEWLLAKPRSRNYSLKVVGAVGAVLAWCVRHELLERTPLVGFRAAKEPAKTPVFLTPADLVKLWDFDFANESLRRSADVFLFQCFTGLAWQDMVNFRASRHLVLQADGVQLLRLERQKTGTPALIPLFRPAAALLAKYGGELLPVPSNAYLNRSLKHVACLLGMPQHLTSHVGRKTAGMVLLQDGVSLTIVSRVLGHKSVRVTERDYVRMLPATVVNELSKIYGPAVMGATTSAAPFLTLFSEELEQRSSRARPVTP